MNDEQIERLWSWVIQNYTIECEERKGEILATANQIFSSIAGYQLTQIEYDLLPQATMLSCLILSELFYLKSCSFPAIRKACKVILVDPRSILTRIPFLQKYCTCSQEELSTWDSITTEKDIHLDARANYIEIPAPERDARFSINIHVIHFAGELLEINNNCNRPAANPALSSRFLELAYTHDHTLSVRFIALSQALLFSRSDYSDYRIYASDLLDAINRESKHENSPIPFYAMALNNRRWG